MHLRVPSALRREGREELSLLILGMRVILGKDSAKTTPSALLPAGPVLTGLGSGNCGFQGRDDVINKTQEKDSEPQSFEGTSCSLTFLQEILSWGVSSTLALCA